MFQCSRELACSILGRPSEDVGILPASVLLWCATARHVGLTPCLYEALYGKIRHNLRGCQNFARGWAGFMSLLEPSFNTLTIVGLACLDQQDWICV